MFHQDYPNDTFYDVDLTTTGFHEIISLMSVCSSILDMVSANFAIVFSSAMAD